MQVDIYKAELYHQPILGTAYHGKEEFLGAYRTDDKMYMICRNSSGSLIQREFFQDYSVEESVNGLPFVSTTIFANFDYEVLTGKMKDSVDDAIRRYNENKEMFESKDMTFIDFLGFARNSVKLSSNTVQCLDNKKYKMLESIHRKNHTMNIYQALEKMQMEQTIEELSVQSEKTLN